MVKEEMKCPNCKKKVKDEKEHLLPSAKFGIGSNSIIYKCDFKMSR